RGRPGAGDRHPRCLAGAGERTGTYDEADRWRTPGGRSRGGLRGGRTAMSSTSRQLRDHAGALRRAAARLTLRRLRLSNTIAEISRSEAPATPRLGDAVHERWRGAESDERRRTAARMPTPRAQ